MHPIIASELSRQMVEDRLCWAEHQHLADAASPAKRWRWRKNRHTA